MNSIINTIVIFLSYCYYTDAKTTHNNNNNNNLSLTYPNMQFRICGAYCGPGWCNNKWLFEKDCDTSVEPEHHIITGDSCADTCCRLHDRCCGQDIHLQHSCNKDIVSCLSKCIPFSLSCTFGLTPMPAEDIEIAMFIVENKCCSIDCENDNSDDTIVTSLFS